LTDFSAWDCSYKSTRLPSYVWSCTDAPPGAPSGPGSSASGGRGGNVCAGKPMVMTDSCCDDGPGDVDYEYPCPLASSCGKGQCIPVGSKLCVDGPTGSTDYVCPAGSSCGRGVCVAPASRLCGTSGTTTCPVTTTCCGTTAATKDTDMVCNDMMDPCPFDRRSSTSYVAMPYIYTPRSTLASLAGGGGDSGGGIGPVLGGVAAAVVILGGGGAYVLRKRKQAKQAALRTREITFQQDLAGSLPGAVTTGTMMIPL